MVKRIQQYYQLCLRKTIPECGDRILENGEAGPVLKQAAFLRSMLCGTIMPLENNTFGII